MLREWAGTDGERGSYCVGTQALVWVVLALTVVGILKFGSVTFLLHASADPRPGVVGLYSRVSEYVADGRVVVGHRLAPFRPY